MASLLSAVIAALSPALPGWTDNLRESSFRGVPFVVDAAGGKGGRRKVVHQFPLRDRPFIEDLGQEANQFRVTAWVAGDDYLQQSLDVLSALQDHDDAAIFVHPWRGEVRCQAGLLSYSENKARGGYCEFEIEFHVDGAGPASPVAQADTASQLLSGIGSALKVGLAAYQDASLIAQHPALLIPFAAGLLGLAASALTGLAPSLLTAVAGTAATIAASVADDAATATAVQTVFQAAATAAIAAATPADPTDDPVLGNPVTIVPGTDLTGGLAALATWGNNLPVPANAIQAAQQLLIQSLIQSNALIAVLTVYASIDWTSSNAAIAARQQAQAMLDAQTGLAAETGQDALYRALQAVGGQALNDLITRAQALPSIVPFSLRASQGALVLAQRWYRDASRADQLVALNDAPDPMFMPFAGQRFAA